MPDPGNHATSVLICVLGSVSGPHPIVKAGFEDRHGDGFGLVRIMISTTLTLVRTLDQTGSLLIH